MTGPPSKRRRRRTRGTHRAESHLAAEADAAGATPACVLAHPLVPGGPPTIIEDRAGVEHLVDRVRGLGVFAFDTEFIGEETYHPRICLVQIATVDEVAIIDPFADVDLAPVWELVAEPTIETIVHAGQQDLEPVVRLLGRPPAQIFDTQIAAAIAGRPWPLGLNRLVEEYADTSLGKSLTFTNWERRPLSEMHARYAADDVRYLPLVRRIIGEAIEAAGRTAWLDEEMAALADSARYRFDADVQLERVSGNRPMPRRRLAVLRALVELRDRAARERDRPPRTLLRDDVLVRLAREPVKDVERLQAVKGLPRPIIEGYGEEIVERTRSALALPTEALPSGGAPEESPAERTAIDSLWALACCWCHGRGIDPSFVTSRKRIAEFRLDRNGDSPLSRGWRRELLGDLLDSFVKGERSIALRWSQGGLHASDA